MKKRKRRIGFLDAVAQFFKPKISILKKTPCFWASDCNKQHDRRRYKRHLDRFYHKCRDWKECKQKSKEHLNSFVHPCRLMSRGKKCNLSKHLVHRACFTHGFRPDVRCDIGESTFIVTSDRMEAISCEFLFVFLTMQNIFVPYADQVSRSRCVDEPEFDHMVNTMKRIRADQRERGTVAVAEARECFKKRLVLIYAGTESDIRESVSTHIKLISREYGARMPRLLFAAPGLTQPFVEGIVSRCVRGGFPKVHFVAPDNVFTTKQIEDTMDVVCGAFASCLKRATELQTESLSLGSPEEEEGPRDELAILLEELGLSEFYLAFREQKISMEDLPDTSFLVLRKIVPDQEDRGRLLARIRGMVQRDVIGGALVRDSDEFVKGVGFDGGFGGENASSYRQTRRRSLPAARQHFLDRRLVKMQMDDSGIIGRTAGCIVRRGVLTDGASKFDVAVKILCASEAMAAREVKLTSSLENANVLGCFGMWAEPDRCCIVLEYCEDGSLQKWLGKRRGAGTLTDALRFSTMLQIAKGLRYLHSVDVIHRDLKPENVLVTNDGTLKICDFGLSKHTGSMTDTMCGTPGYIPNPLRYTESTDKRTIDVFSFGVMCWEIWAGRRPFEALRMRQGGDALGMIIQIHAEGLRPPLDQCKNMPQELKELIARCWDDTPEVRPLFDEVIKTMEDIKIKYPALLEEVTPS